MRGVARRLSVTGSDWLAICSVCDSPSDASVTGWPIANSVAASPSVASTVHGGGSTASRMGLAEPCATLSNATDAAAGAAVTEL